MSVWLIRTGTHKVRGSGKAEVGTATIVHTTGIGPWRQSRCVWSKTEQGLPVSHFSKGRKSRAISLPGQQAGRDNHKGAKV